MSAPDPATGFVPPPYPHDRLTDVREVAAAVPGGLIDCSVGTPVDPFPDVARRALDAAMGTARGYPPT
ncbi:MAG TPA: succinyldiaminopimelate transaminase, partial [Acidimicrobiia bacterium]